MHITDHRLGGPRQNRYHLINDLPSDDLCSSQSWRQWKLKLNRVEQELYLHFRQTQAPDGIRISLNRISKKLDCGSNQVTLAIWELAAKGFLQVETDDNALILYVEPVPHGAKSLMDSDFRGQSMTLVAAFDRPELAPHERAYTYLKFSHDPQTAALYLYLRQRARPGDGVRVTKDSIIDHFNSNPWAISVRLAKLEAERFIGRRPNQGVMAVRPVPASEGDEVPDVSANDVEAFFQGPAAIPVPAMRLVSNVSTKSMAQRLVGFFNDCLSAKGLAVQVGMNRWTQSDADLLLSHHTFAELAPRAVFFIDQFNHESVENYGRTFRTFRMQLAVVGEQLAAHWHNNHDGWVERTLTSWGLAEKYPGITFNPLSFEQQQDKAVHEVVAQLDQELLAICFAGVPEEVEDWTEVRPETVPADEKTLRAAHGPAGSFAHTRGEIRRIAIANQVTRYLTLRAEEELADLGALRSDVTPEKYEAAFAAGLELAKHRFSRVVNALIRHADELAHIPLVAEIIETYRPGGQAVAA
ncbi:MAG: hypothetical protein HY875_10505 [Chloroflexi bacterium]|nr:hypothetical protein [Chloroflexota bacterium]